MSDPKKREIYDIDGEEGVRHSEAHGGNRQNDFDSFFGGGGGGFHGFGGHGHQ